MTVCHLAGPPAGRVRVRDVRAPRALLSALLLVLLCPGARALPPTGWRNDTTGHYPDAAPPTEWSATKNVRWSTPVGRSYSSPVVAGNLVFVTSEPDRLLCLDRGTGKVLWTQATTPADLPDAASQAAAKEYEPPKDGSGLTAATPLVDGQLVFIVLANGIVRAVDLAGKPKWAAYIDAPQSTGYGRAASPILVGGKLVVHMTHLYAFDPATGKRLWVNDRAKSTYGSPAGFKAGDVDLIATPAGDVCRADDGKTVASDLGATLNASPIPADEDGVFYALGDGQLRAIRLDATFKDKEVWSGEIPGEVYGSPLRVDDTVFIVTSNCRLYAFDAKGKGERQPLIDARPLFPAEGEQEPVAYASLTRAGKYVYVNNLKGETAVLEANRAAKPVARNKLPHGAGGNPVFAGKDLFLRDGDKLYCISAP